MTQTPASSGSVPVDLEPIAYDTKLARLTALLLLVGVAVRLLSALDAAPLWGDEAMLAMNIATRDYSELTQPLSCGQVAPVLFLWAERLAFVSLGSSEWVLRLVPLLASLGALVLFRDLAQRTLPPTGAVLAVGLMALSSWPIGMANTLKPYSSDLFWSLVLLVLAVRWHEAPGRLLPLAALAAVVPLALAGSYPAVFVAGAVAVYLLPTAWRAGPGAKVLYVWYAIAMFGTFAATYLLIGAAQIGPGAGQTGALMSQYWRHGFPPRDPLRVPGWLLAAHTGRAFAYPVGDRNGASSLTAALVVVGALAWWHTGRRWLLALCLLPFALNLVAAGLEKYPYAGCCRLSQHLAPSICLLAGSGWAVLIERCRERRAARLSLVRWAAVLLIALAVGGYVLKQVRPNRGPLPDFSRNLYRELTRVAEPGDRVVVYTEEYTDVTLLWNLQRLGNRVVWAEPGTPLPDAPRVWVVSVGSSDDRAAHTRVATPPPGWKVVATTVWFVCRGDRDPYGVWWHAWVTCLARITDPRPEPRLHVSP